jgi:short-subunit dehydrogenase
MKNRLKPIKDQVIVITGASSGIGLATAYEASKQGARVVLTSRNTDDLNRAVDKITRGGGQAACVTADVTHDSEMQKVADFAIRQFGGFDTWVNNAGASVYGRLLDTPIKEKRQVFDINFWGVVHGCKAAVNHLKEKGGAIINVGSEVSEHPLPLQGIYSASKHAVKAYTDALRMELEKDGLPISVTLIKPAAINTPFTTHAKNHMEREPELPPPLYAPEVVAAAILACARKPMQSLFVGGSGFFLATLQKLFPRLAEKSNKGLFFEKQKATTPKHRDEGLMKTPEHEGELYGDSPHKMKRSSFYTNVALHPIATALFVVGASGAAVKGVRSLQEWKLKQRRAA